MTAPLVGHLADLLFELGCTEDDTIPLTALADALVELDLDTDDDARHAADEGVSNAERH